MSDKPLWARNPIKCLFLDIHGVLFECGAEAPIEGSVDAINRIKDAGLEFCLLTNECCCAQDTLCKSVADRGFSQIKPEQIVAPAPVVCRYLRENKLKPHLFVGGDVHRDFDFIINEDPEREPDCLVVGDPMENVSRNAIDHSLNVLLESKCPLLLAMGAGRYFKDAGILRMDTGAYTAAFEYASGVKALNFGKPSESFFREAIKKVDIPTEHIAMIGDDVVSDVGGAQRIGLRGFLVRSGKYKPSDECRADVRPDCVFDNLSQAVSEILLHNASFK